MKQKEHIFLDYNATTPLNIEVKEAMNQVMDIPYNPSSVHHYGRKSKQLIEEARTKVANLAGADSAQVIFTSSGTEANNLALHGIQKVDKVVVSAIEHSSILVPAKKCNADTIPVDAHGIVDLKALEKILQNVSGRVLVSVMLANNETGVIQPIKEIATLVYAHKGYLHCDAAQALGKIPVDMQDLNVDMLTISAHKFAGPQGAAALIIKNGLHVTSQIRGGGQEYGYRSGTENVAALVGFGKAAELAKENVSNYTEIRQLRDQLEQEINAIASDVVIVGENVKRLPNTSTIIMPMMKAETQVINFDIEGIALSAGSACSSGKVEMSHVLLAMGFDKEVASRAIRVSLGLESKIEDIRHFIKIWKMLYERSCQQQALSPYKDITAQAA